jgi:hypothetical protein
MRHKILLVGIISNVASTIEKELRIVLSALSSFKEINIFLVESDSTDCTLEVLGKLQRLDPRIEVISKGHLSQQLPNRIQRIAYCREIYVEFIKMNYKNKKWEYVAVADLDGMNFKLSKKGVESCFDSNIEWDGMMANQRFGYYDIYALRAAGWVENDCFLELKNLKESTTQPKIGKSKAINFIRLFLYFDNLRKVTIYKKMKILRKRNGFVPVKSAFGGFAIYKTKVFLNSSYESNNYNQSEHVNFHLLNSSKNKRFFINPSLINSNLNVYNLNKIRLIRFLREIKKYLNF